jgi:hypothetical protein
MPSITMFANYSEPVAVDRLFKFQRDTFPGQANMIRNEVSGYSLELDDQRADFLLELLSQFDCIAFEPFREWEARKRDQLTLDLDPRKPASGAIDPDNEFGSSAGVTA